MLCTPQIKQFVVCMQVTVTATGEPTFAATIPQLAQLIRNEIKFTMFLVVEIDYNDYLLYLKPHFFV